MKLAVVAYPILGDVDRLWIESFRTRHDPQASRLGAHFTLVFPVEAMPHELEPELTAVAQSSQPVLFVIRRIQVARDALGDGFHVFLVPDEGGVEISTLHGRLYGGSFRPHRRAEIPFVPHMTLGAGPDSEAAEKLAEELRVGFRTVQGQVADMALVDVGMPHVRSIRTYALGASR